MELKWGLVVEGAAVLAAPTSIALLVMKDAYGRVNKRIEKVFLGADLF